MTINLILSTREDVSLINSYYYGTGAICIENQFLGSKILAQIKIHLRWYIRESFHRLIKTILENSNSTKIEARYKKNNFKSVD